MAILAYKTDLRGECSDKIADVVNQSVFFRLLDQEAREGGRVDWVISTKRRYFEYVPDKVSDELQELWEHGVRGHIILVWPDCEAILRYDLLKDGIVEQGCVIKEANGEQS